MREAERSTFAEATVRRGGRTNKKQKTTKHAYPRKQIGIGETERIPSSERGEHPN